MANVFVNYVSEKLIHSNQTKDGGRQFANVSVPVPTDVSLSGLGSFAVNLGQILDAKKKDGTVVEGYKNLLLGAPDKTRKVSVQTADGYAQIEITNAAIAEYFVVSRKAYRAAQKEA